MSSQGEVSARGRGGAGGLEGSARGVAGQKEAEEEAATGTRKKEKGEGERGARKSGWPGGGREKNRERKSGKERDAGVEKEGPHIVHMRDRPSAYEAACIDQPKSATTPGVLSASLAFFGTTAEGGGAARCWRGVGRRGDRG